jgi:uncharacterized protein with ATP-grasp and redox domains
LLFRYQPLGRNVVKRLVLCWELLKLVENSRTKHLTTRCSYAIIKVELRRVEEDKMNTSERQEFFRRVVEVAEQNDWSEETRNEWFESARQFADESESESEQDQE